MIDSEYTDTRSENVTYITRFFAGLCLIIVGFLIISIPGCLWSDDCKSKRALTIALHSAFFGDGPVTHFGLFLITTMIFTGIFSLVFWGADLLTYKEKYKRKKRSDAAAHYHNCAYSRMSELTSCLEHILDTHRAVLSQSEEDIVNRAIARSMRR